MGYSSWGCKESDMTERLHFQEGRGQGTTFKRTTHSCMRVQSPQPCLTLHDPVDCSPPGSSVRGIL